MLTQTQTLLTIAMASCVVLVRYFTRINFWVRLRVRVRVRVINVVSSVCKKLEIIRLN